MFCEGPRGFLENREQMTPMKTRRHGRQVREEDGDEFNLALGQKTKALEI